MDKKQTCLTYGSFEFVHRGHLQVLNTLVQVAKEEDLTSVVVSCPAEGSVFTTEEEKAYLMKQAGIETVVTCKDKKDTETFVKTLIDTFDVKVFVIGENSKDREVVKNAANTAGIKVILADTVKVEGQEVSYGLLKSAYEKGDYERITELCGHPYIVMGEVVHGKALGRTVGMPTANLCVQKEKIKPYSGVYATKVIYRKKEFMSVTNVGKRPTVDDDDRITIETYILDFSEEIYGQTLILEIGRFVRGVQKFESLEAVQAQVQKDISVVNSFFRNKNVQSIH